jgi:hypothetical protein
MSHAPEQLDMWSVEAAPKEQATPRRCAGADGSALSGLENCPLHRRTPFGMTNVSMTQFSIARYSMGCTLNGDHYVYVPKTDELIRADVLKWKKKHEKAKQNNQAERQP